MSGESLTVDSGILTPLPALTSYLLLFRGPVNLDIPADVTGATVFFNLTPTQSENLEPGAYDVYFVETTDSTRKVLLKSQMEVTPNLFVAGDPVDIRTFNEKMVQALEAYILGKADNDQLDHLKAVETHRELHRMSSTELQQLLDKYRRRLWREKNPGRGSHIPRLIFQTFNRVP